jgi:hypothetical protein
MTKRILQIAVAMTLLTTSGCVAVKNKRAPQSWPKPISATGIKQFEGLYNNRSVDRTTGKPGERTYQLFDFLRGRSHSHGNRGVYVEVSSSFDDTVLHVRLLDEQHLEIDSASLQHDSDFELTRGFLTLHGPYSGTRAGSGNIAVGVEDESSRLYVSSTCDLLGRQSDRSAGLLFYFVPFISAGRHWMLWPKLSAK